MLEIICEEKGAWGAVADAVFCETRQNADLSAELLFVGEEEIMRLNRDTRGLNRVTDVLSYPTLDGIRGAVLNAGDFPFDTEDGRLMIGSVVICEARAAEQAAELLRMRRNSAILQQTDSAFRLSHRFWSRSASPAGRRSNSR